MKIPDVKAAIDEEWEKLEQLLAWQVTNVKSKKDVMERHKKREGLSNIDGLMSHFTNSELDAQYPKDKSCGTPR